jgi:hypothetical protein
MSFGGQTPTIIVLKEGTQSKKHPLSTPILILHKAPTSRKAEAKSSPTSTPV